MAYKIEDIKSKAIAIRDATDIGENTAERVGSAIYELADYTEERFNDGVPPATHTTYGGIKISGTITDNPPSGAYGVVSMAGGLAYVPMASFSIGTGTATTGVVDGWEWYETQHAKWAVNVLTGGTIPDGAGDDFQPLKVSDEGDAGYSIGLWQDGNAFRGGSIPLASGKANGLLSKDYQPYLSALWDIYADGDELKEKLQDVDGSDISKLADRVSALEAGGGGTETSTHFKELGQFASSGEAEAVAADPINAGNRDLVLMHYTLTNGGSGIIMQQVDGSACTQIIGLAKFYQRRTIVFTDSTRTTVQSKTAWKACFVDELAYTASSRLLSMRWGGNFTIGKVTLPLASSTADGMMSALDKNTLDAVSTTYATQENLRTVGKMASEAQQGYIANMQTIAEQDTRISDLEKYGIVGTLSAWNNIAKLTTASTEAEILAALYVTPNGGSKTTTQAELNAILDQCAIRGKWLKESSTNGKVSVEYIGSCYVLQIVGSKAALSGSNIVGVPVVRNITISASGTLRVLRNPSEIKLDDIASLSKRADSVDTFLSGYLGKEDDFDTLYAGLDARISELEENGGTSGGGTTDAALAKRVASLEAQVAALTALLQMT